MSYAYEEPGYIKICGYIKKPASNYYHFTCPKCKVDLRLGTDGGRYGNIGEFTCQSCGSKYYATDDDCNPNSPLHIFENNQKLFDLQKEHILD
ncbi:hypothetical protein I5677_14650 [Mobilitalea sibirica]|uniref:Uncharacterized protein n=1 Tax=Mobilitalea sibirica TaxID=1462919 RepID=A0A8J7HEF7_9FIRM|nr:hypothetical protein [Mobilitalea sibirica]MBH1942139.1 hypothetical protein [Mobilitalea sibirica]